MNDKSNSANTYLREEKGIFFLSREIFCPVAGKLVAYLMFPTPTRPAEPNPYSSNHVKALTAHFISTAEQRVVSRSPSPTKMGGHVDDPLSPSSASPRIALTPQLSSETVKTLKELTSHFRIEMLSSVIEVVKEESNNLTAASNKYNGSVSKQGQQHPSQRGAGKTSPQKLPPVTLVSTPESHPLSSDDLHEIEDVVCLLPMYKEVHEGVARVSVLRAIHGVVVCCKSSSILLEELKNEVRDCLD